VWIGLNFSSIRLAHKLNITCCGVLSVVSSALHLPAALLAGASHYEELMAALT
jgi:hypothetical protein